MDKLMIGLGMIRSNADLTTRGHSAFNAVIGKIMADGLADYAGSRRIGYKLTAKGNAVLDGVSRES